MLDFLFGVLFVLFGVLLQYTIFYRPKVRVMSKAIYYQRGVVLKKIDEINRLDSRISDLEAITCRTTNRSEGYLTILTALLEAARKASDEFLKNERS